MIECVGTQQGLDAAKNCRFTGPDACHEKVVRFDPSMTHPDREMSVQEGDHPCQDQ